MKPLKQSELTKGISVIIRNEGCAKDAIITSCHNGILCTNNIGIVFANDFNFYPDTPATRAWLLLQKEKVV